MVKGSPAIICSHHPWIARPVGPISSSVDINRLSNLLFFNVKDRRMSTGKKKSTTKKKTSPRTHHSLFVGCCFLLLISGARFLSLARHRNIRSSNPLPANVSYFGLMAGRIRGSLVKDSWHRRLIHNLHHRNIN